MRVKLLIVLGLLVIGMSSLPAHAKMVYYYDEQGNVHYVNTDFARVPEQYLHQVLPQLEAADSTPAEPQGQAVSPVIPQNQVLQEPAPVKPILVQVFISDGCDDCTRLEIMLRSRKIIYTRHDVNTDRLGKEFLKNAGKTIQLPTTKINKKVVVVGADIRKILNAIEQEKDATTK